MNCPVPQPPECERVATSTMLSTAHRVHVLTVDGDAEGAVIRVRASVAGCRWQLVIFGHAGEENYAPAGGQAVQQQIIPTSAPTRLALPEVLAAKGCRLYATGPQGAEVWAEWGARGAPPCGS